MKILFTTFFLYLLMGLLTACESVDQSIDVSEDLLASNADVATLALSANENQTQLGNVQKMALSAVDSPQATITEDQRSVYLQWEDHDSYRFTLVRANNSDCDPITSGGCEEIIKIPNLGNNGYVDDDIVQGGIYYYWIIASVNSRSESEGNTTPSVTSSPDLVDTNNRSDKSRLSVASKIPTVVEIAIRDDLDNLIPERPGTAFPQNVYMTGSDVDTIVVNWDYKPGFEVLVYATDSVDCDIASYLSEDVYAVDTQSDPCAVEVARSTSSSVHIARHMFVEKVFLWAIVVVSGTPLATVVKDANLHRLVGPYLVAQNAKRNGDMSLVLIEKAQSSAHSISIAFQEMTRYLPSETDYHLIVISSPNPIDINKAQARLAQNYIDNYPVKGYDLNEVDLAIGMRTFGRVQVKKLRHANFVREGLAFSYPIKVEANQWHTVFLRVTDGVTLEAYTPASMRSSMRISVQVQGKYGLWQLLDKDGNVVFSMRESGSFYPGLVDWRQYSLVAQMAKPDFWAYYFSACPYYVNTHNTQQNQQLFNNRCLFALSGDDDSLITPFEKPPEIMVTFEPRANVAGCKTHQIIENTQYSRGRYNQTSNTQTLLCDYRKVSRGDDDNPFYFTFTQPHGAPAELAKGKVDMWHSGTQTPIFLESGSKIPSTPNEQTKARVCADFAPNDTRCDWTAVVDIVRCNGYYAYRLAEPSGCSMAYALEEDPMSTNLRLLQQQNQ